MLVVESIAVAVGIIVVASLAVWCLFTLVKITGMAKEERSNEAPYKVERPMSAEQLAISIAHKSAKRKYTKRSKCWTDKRKKAAARKAKKKTHKFK